MLNPLTPKELRHIQRDWKNALELYIPEKGRTLIKRNGPILTGVYLSPKGGNTKYEALFFTHSLLTSWIVGLTLTSAIPLRREIGGNVLWTVDFENHKENFEKMLSDFNEQCPILSKGEIALSDLLKIYESEKHPSISPYDFKSLQDYILILQWFGKTELAKQKLAEFSITIKEWEREKVNVRYEEWRDVIEKALDKKVMEETVVIELEKRKLENLKDYNIICDL